jgi:hypothetical protein
MGSLRTIAAVHHQINLAIATPHSPYMECKNVVARDSSEINLLPVLCVLGAPNLDVTPARPAPGDYDKATIVGRPGSPISGGTYECAASSFEPRPKETNQDSGTVPLVHPKILIAFGAALSRGEISVLTQRTITEDFDRFLGCDFPTRATR